MKKTFKTFVTLFLLVFVINQGIAQPPTYNLVARNFSLEDTLGGDDNMLKFDINLQWTNPGSSNTFYYGPSQYCLTFNNVGIQNGGTFVFSKIGSELPSNLQPATFQVSNSQLRMTANIPGDPFIVSAVFPGTLVVKVRLRTTALQFGVDWLKLAWKNSGTGLNTKLSYMNSNNMIEVITDSNSYVIDSSGLNGQPLPVECSSFTSNVSRNTVSLNWATTREINNQGFDIERKSVEGTEWTKIGNVNGNGTTTETRSYSFSDRAATGNFNYRLKQIDFNGNFAYYNLGNEVVVGVPSQYAISQNYPNPFNPSTKIDYDIPFDGKVSVLLYDLSGRQVGNLVNDVKTAGYYTVNFNASNLASGMYFYRINAEGNGNNFVSTKKMVLIK